MKKLVATGASLAIVLSALAMLATPASARHHHHHHHHGVVGTVPPCTNPITVLPCSISSPPAPPGPTPAPIQGGFALTPSNVTLVLNSAFTGNFATSVIGSGLPTGITGTLSGPGAGITCTGLTINGVAASTGVALTTDFLGRFTASIAGTSCNEGTLPFSFQETTAPFAGFTAVLSLHF